MCSSSSLAALCRTHVARNKCGEGGALAEAQAGEHAEEAPFAVGDDQALTGGVIDLLFEAAAGWQVRDYKTDLALDAAAYASQFETYRRALRALGCVAADAALVPVRQD
jgi:ATP-dependent exoDNAse (exonuclease V) beta subunit